MEAPIVSGDDRDRYLVSSLIEESITSSQLEGAATTREEAKAMLRSGRKPHDRSERMILNNFHAMELIRALRDESFTPDRIVELHRIVTQDALDDPDASGRLRTGRERVQVVDAQHANVLHEPSATYSRAYLNTETDANDTNYFIIHQLTAIEQAITTLYDYLGRKAAEQRDAEDLLRHASVSDMLNHRQIALLGQALGHPGHGYTVESHRRSHRVTTQSARASSVTSAAEQDRTLNRPNALTVGGVAQEVHAEHRHGVLAGGRLGIGLELIGGLPGAGRDLPDVLQGVPCHLLCSVVSLLARASAFAPRPVGLGNGQVLRFGIVQHLNRDKAAVA